MYIDMNDFISHYTVVLAKKQNKTDTQINMIE